MHKQTNISNCRVQHMEPLRFRTTSSRERIVDWSESDTGLVSGQSHRSGSLIIEMIVGMVMLSVVAAALTPALHAVVRQRQSMRFETLSLIELNNLATQQQLQKKNEKTQLSLWFQERYQDALLESKSLDRTDHRMQAIQLSIHRSTENSLDTARRALTVWVPEGS